MNSSKPHDFMERYLIELMSEYMGDLKMISVGVARTHPEVSVCLTISYFWQTF